NGAGKTTTMKILTGYIPQTSGQAFVCGHDVEKEPMEVRKKIGYLPEHNPLYLDMYVREYLHFIAGLHGIRKPKGRVEEMVELTGLQREQHKLIGALSKGYRQRVGLAQALMHDPQVLILDEPTAGLDPNQLADIRSLIKKLGEEKTVIFSTHIMQEVKAICDRVIIINKGELVADDTIDHLQTASAGNSIVTAEFSTAIPASKLRALPGVQEVRQLQHNRYQLISAGEEDLRPTVFDFAVEQGTKLLEMQKEGFEMDEVFQRLTK
ncbi:MAG: ATP-binding cassette domain-containing protein, partial [Bacteroidetes bacterium]|nr:ATP-binding cassette domain-containing protein [Bacteroidota bacterium]